MRWSLRFRAAGFAAAIEELTPPLRWAWDRGLRMCDFAMLGLLRFWIEGPDSDRCSQHSDPLIFRP